MVQYPKINQCDTKSTKVIEEVNLNYYEVKRGFSGGTSGKELTCQCRRHETWVQSLGQEDPLDKRMAPTSVFLPGRILRRQEPGSPHSSRGHKELNTTDAT